MPRSLDRDSFNSQHSESMTFKQWLTNQTKRNDFIGQMATQLSKDETWQTVKEETLRSPARCSHHLEIHGYPDSICEGMDKAWKAYHEKFYPDVMFTKFRVYEG